MARPNEYLDFNAEAGQAVEAGNPVLALESTIITHGMPWPRNAEMTRQVQQAVRDAGAVPATIAILDGRLKVGLEDGELDRLARLGEQAVKCSRRDLPFMIQSTATAGTTVAATMIIAALAGIRIFATGGIGGVHRDAGRTFDVSADLHELARTRVGVVCAGPKSILDIGLTLEVLETLGVPVVGFGTDELPAFYSRSSGFGVDYRLDSAAAIADSLKARWSLGLEGGMVIANPIPEAAALDRQTMEQCIGEAINDATDAGIHGKELTPFLLHKVEELTAGASLDANVALMVSNAQLGAAIAIELNR